MRKEPEKKINLSNVNILLTNSEANEIKQLAEHGTILDVEVNSHPPEGMV
jgi:hypothetical protein